MDGILISKWLCPPTERESVDRDGTFTSRRGPGEGSVARGQRHGNKGTASRPPTRR